MRKGLLILVLGLSLACSMIAAPTLADNPASRAIDAQEHAALMELASSERALYARFKPEAVEKLKKLQHERASWKYAPEVELDLARALMFKGEHTEALAGFKRVIDKNADPLSCAWAALYTSDCLCRMKNYPAAAAKAISVAAYLDSLDDLQPVLQAQGKLAKLIADGKVDRSILASAPPAFADTVEMAVLVDQGDLEGARAKYGQIVSSLKGRASALTTVRLVSSEIVYFSHSKEKDETVVEHVKQLIGDLEGRCPTDSWLVGKAKLAAATSLVCSRTSLATAEQYLGDIIEDGKVANRMPSAYTLLAECLYAQKRYSEATEIASEEIAKYPYSTWTDYCTYLLANSQYRDGKKDAAKTTIDSLIQLYPDSEWSRAAASFKKVVWR